MPSRCLNKVTLIGNLTRDPELRYTPSGMAVVSFGLATNRVWVTKQGERKEDAQFHRIVAWNKLAELCSQLLVKGRRVYVEGRIQYREFTDSENNKKQIAEIIIDDMIILDNKGSGVDRGEAIDLAGSPSTEETEMTAANEGGIEDIVIPDDIGEVPVEEKPEEEKPEEEKTEEETADKKEDEMPF